MNTEQGLCEENVWTCQDCTENSHVECERFQWDKAWGCCCSAIIGSPEYAEFGA